MRTYTDITKTRDCNGGFNFTSLIYDELSDSDKTTLSRLLSPSQIKEVIKRLSDDSCSFVTHDKVEFSRLV